MIEERTYSVGMLKKMIREMAEEFNPVIGANVESDNKKNNDKSYKDAEKAAKDFDGGLKAENKGKLSDKEDYNRTTLDYNPRTPVSKDFKDKVDAQAKGYTSKMEMENGIAKAAEFDNDGKIKKNITDANDKINKEKSKLETSGIQGHNIGEKESKNTMYENTTPKAKRFTFKHTKFLNEAQMLARIPEEYKRDGQKIYMKDAAENEYIVECSLSEKTGIVETNVVGFNNEKLMNEQVARINQLFEYETPATYAPSSSKVRLEESNGFEDMMNLSRSLIK